MRITPDEVRKVARLARLSLPDDELQRIAADMDAILDYVADLETLDTDAIVPTAHAVPLENAVRPDELRPTAIRDAVLAVAPAAAENCFRVPKVIE